MHFSYKESFKLNNLAYFLKDHENTVHKDLEIKG